MAAVVVVGGRLLLLPVVVQPIAFEVPAPRLRRHADQRPVARAGQRRLVGGHAHDGVRPALFRRPRDLPAVETT